MLPVSPAQPAGPSRSLFTVDGFNFPAIQDLNTAPSSELYRFDADGSVSAFENKSHPLQLPHVPGGTPANQRTGSQEPSIKDSSTCDIEAQSHANRLDIQAQMMSGKGTDPAYKRQLLAYEKYYDALQLTNPTMKSITAHPITVAKVALFLKHESTRKKRSSDGQEIAGTSLGSEHIKQVISALERYRYDHQHEDVYKNCPESRVPLRSDVRITTFEAAAKSNEPQRIAESQSLKATGVSADTYKEEDLTRASISLLRACGKTKQQVIKGNRDRSMLLISTATAFRGDNTRALLWSDLGVRDIPLVDVGLTATAMALILISDQGKTNTSGRIDEQAAFRHRLPELCCVGALGFYLFTRFHVSGLDRPDFSPDYSDTNYGEFGRRDWYGFYLFPGGKGEKTQISYENHRKCVNKIHMHNGIANAKVTHAGRAYAAVHAREHRATADDTRDLGNWSHSGSYKTYDRTLPLDGMIAAASFNAKKQSSYVIARDKLEPPLALLQLLFPWAEAEEASLQERRLSIGKAGEDYALKHFLHLLIRLRRIILQDAAVLFSKYPDCPLFTFAPFDSPEFRTWAATSTRIIEAAEQKSRHQLELLPETIATSFNGVMTTHNIQQEKAMDEYRRDREENNRRLAGMEALMHASLLGTKKQRREAVLNAAKTLTDFGLPTAMHPSTASTSTSASTSHLEPCSDLNVGIDGPSASSSAPTITIPGQDTVSHLSSTIISSATTTNTNITVSISGTVYPPNVFPLSTDSFERTKQLDAIKILESKFSVSRLQRHEFEWVRSLSQKQQDEWLPHYKWWTPKQNGYPTVDDIWTEHHHGMDGQLSVQELTSGWDARWKRNTAGLKSEGTRRKKIITLIETLASKPNWSDSLALRFLKEKYPIPTSTVDHLTTTRNFIKGLQNKDGVLLTEILVNAQSYSA